jgi:hypothetical protein
MGDVMGAIISDLLGQYVVQQDWTNALQLVQEVDCSLAGRKSNAAIGSATQLGLKEMSGLFIFFAVGSAIIIFLHVVSLFVEPYWHKSRSKLVKAVSKRKHDELQMEQPPTVDSRHRSSSNSTSFLHFFGSPHKASYDSQDQQHQQQQQQQQHHHQQQHQQQQQQQQQQHPKQQQTPHEQHLARTSRFNKLTGSLPSSIGQLQNLSYLLLSSNRLNGSLVFPTELGCC